MIAYHVLLLPCALLALASCSRRETVDAQTKDFDVCSLLTSREIETIQGAPIRQSVSSKKSEKGIVVSQCYFVLPTAAESITLVVMRKENSSVSRGPRQLWQETFHSEKKERDEEEEGKGEKAAPEKIDALGDEAFWTGLQFGGTLHVLKGDYNIRISVGGPGDTATQVQKLKSLAGIVLQRLQ